MKILVTGASGFIGSFIVEEAVKRGFQVFAGIRKTSSKSYLTHPCINFVELDLSNYEVLCSQLQNIQRTIGKWDVVIHAAGATKCVKGEEFFKTNTDGTRHLVDALVKLKMIPQRFIFLSSLSVYGAIREQSVRQTTIDNPWIYSPIKEGDTPQPNTMYGISKLRAEEYIKSIKDFPYVILRPTGVYGPREKDYFLMAKSIKQHVDFCVGYKLQEITFVYVSDLVQAVFKAMERDVVGREFFISDGQIYRSTEFSDLIRKELNNPFILRVKAPVWFLCIICYISGFISSLRGKTTTLNKDKFHILRQRNWQCDIEPAQRELDYHPKYLLERGVKETIAWYKNEGWL